jgi:Tfp pilus assembly protein PilV
MIEVMVAVLLTAIATSGIIALYTVETRASGFSRHTTEASVLAQDQLELLRTSKIMGTATVIGMNELGVVVAGGLFTRTYTVAAGVGGPYDEVEVLVSWTEDGLGRTVRLKSRRNQ